MTHDITILRWKWISDTKIDTIDYGVFVLSPVRLIGAYLLRPFVDNGVFKTYTDDNNIFVICNTVAKEFYHFQTGTYNKDINPYKYCTNPNDSFWNILVTEFGSENVIQVPDRYKDLINIIKNAEDNELYAGM